LKEIFISQNEFANEFKIKSDMVSDYLKGQLTPDQILKKFEII
jgi:predicted transcriptional regulator